MKNKIFIFITEIFLETGTIQSRAVNTNLCHSPSYLSLMLFSCFFFLSNFDKFFVVKSSKNYSNYFPENCFDMIFICLPY